MKEWEFCRWAHLKSYVAMSFFVTFTDSAKYFSETLLIAYSETLLTARSKSSLLYHYQFFVLLVYNFWCFSLSCDIHLAKRCCNRCYRLLADSIFGLEISFLISYSVPFQWGNLLYYFVPIHFEQQVGSQFKKM